MKHILDIGQQGAEHVDVVSPTASVAVEGIQPYLSVINRFPTEKIEAEVDDGTKKSIEVYTLLINHPKVFGMIWAAAMFEPMVYARQDRRTVLGMLSPNFDAHGEVRQPSIKVLPLDQAYPLTSKLLPNEQMATMLAGSAHAEGQGSGGHDKPIEQDYEHKLTMVGAISLDKKTIIDETGQHVQHASRTDSSVTAGLSNGRLGNMFLADGDNTGGFPGYGAPMIFHRDRTTATDVIYFPKSFVESELAYGAHYDEASRIVYGAGLQIMYGRKGQAAVTDEIKQLAGEG